MNLTKNYIFQFQAQPRSSLGTQTDFRESEVQTLPCSLTAPNQAIKGELGALEVLKYGRGLPAQVIQRNPLNLVLAMFLVCPPVVKHHGAESTRSRI